MLTEGIILKCSLHFGQSRTSSAIYHLIKGKRSIQTVQDAHSYNLSNFYGINGSLRKSEYDKIINKLISDKLLQMNDLMCCFVTDSGKKLLEQSEVLGLNNFNGLQYHNISPAFYDRLIMLTQTLSNSLHNHYSFIPVIDKPPVLDWVRVIFKQIRHDKESYSNQFYDELYRLMSGFSEERASIYVDRFSGYNHYGKSKDQLAQEYKKDRIEISFIIENTNHSILNKIYDDPHSFQAIGSLVADLQNKQLITNSAKKTYELFQKNYSIYEISYMRNLKENTIYDHVVEVALFTPDFPVSNFVTEEQQQEITNAVKEKNTYRLKEIKQLVGQEISYFQIRLVLALLDQKGNNNE